MRLKIAVPRLNEDEEEEEEEEEDCFDGLIPLETN